MVQVLVKVEQLAEGCGLSARGPRAERSWEGVRDDQQWHAQIHGLQPLSVCVCVLRDPMIINFDITSSFPRSVVTE